MLGLPSLLPPRMRSRQKNVLSASYRSLLSRAPALSEISDLPTVYEVRGQRSIAQRQVFFYYCGRGGRKCLLQSSYRRCFCSPIVGIFRKTGQWQILGLGLGVRGGVRLVCPRPDRLHGAAAQERQEHPRPNAAPLAAHRLPGRAEYSPVVQRHQRPTPEQIHGRARIRYSLDVPASRLETLVHSALIRQHTPGRRRVPQPRRRRDLGACRLP